MVFNWNLMNLGIKTILVGIAHKQNCNITKRAAGKWDSPRLRGIFLASSLYCSQAESRSTHLRLTQTVGLMI